MCVCVCLGGVGVRVWIACWLGLGSMLYYGTVGLSRLTVLTVSTEASEFSLLLLLPLLRPLAPITARKLRKNRSILWLKGLAVAAA